MFVSVFGVVQCVRKDFQKQKQTVKLTVTALLSGLEAVFQSAGGFFPIIGLFISPLATAPILLCTMFSLPLGLMSYFLTGLMLLILQPAELIIFPFTTGLLGLGIGLAFHLFKRRIAIIITGALALLLGILTLLYIFQFPVLGPIAPRSFSFLSAGGLLLFAFLYSWAWVEVGIIIVKRLRRAFSARN